MLRRRRAISITLIGDTHGEFRKIPKLPNENKLIVLGDFGFVWYNRFHSKYKCQQKNLLNFKNKTLVVLGNHENYSVIESLPIIEKYGGKVRKCTNNIFFLMNGEVYIIEDKKFFVMGGAKSVDRNNRIENVSWWGQELPTTSDYENGLANLEKHDYKVDYILSHECCSDIYKEMYSYYELYALPNYLQLIKNKTEYTQHYFGHHHRDEVFNRGQCLYDTHINLP